MTTKPTTAGKVYTNRSNCSRAAKAELGKTALCGVEFTIDGSGKEWRWAPKAKPAKEPKAPRRKLAPGEQPDVRKQPGMIALMAAITGTPATVNELATQFSQEQHTVRGSISRLRTAGARIIGLRVGRTMFDAMGEEATADLQQRKAEHDGPAEAA